MLNCSSNYDSHFSYGKCTLQSRTRRASRSSPRNFETLNFEMYASPLNFSLSGFIIPGRLGFFLRLACGKPQLTTVRISRVCACARVSPNLSKVKSGIRTGFCLGSCHPLHNIVRGFTSLSLGWISLLSEACLGTWAISPQQPQLTWTSFWF